MVPGCEGGHPHVPLSQSSAWLGNIGSAERHHSRITSQRHHVNLPIDQLSVKPRLLDGFQDPLKLTVCMAGLVADHCKAEHNSLPGIEFFDLGHGYVELSPQAIGERSNHLPLILQRVTCMQVQSQYTGTYVDTQSRTFCPTPFDDNAMLQRMSRHTVCQNIRPRYVPGYAARGANQD